jgi:hypothetical protein
VFGEVRDPRTEEGVTQRRDQDRAMHQVQQLCGSFSAGRAARRSARVAALGRTCRSDFQAPVLSGLLEATEIKKV